MIQGLCDPVYRKLFIYLFVYGTKPLLNDYLLLLSVGEGYVYYMSR